MKMEGLGNDFVVIDGPADVSRRLIGSPTVPITRSDERSWAAGYSSPHFMNALMAVGAV